MSFDSSLWAEMAKHPLFPYQNCSVGDLFDIWPDAYKDDAMQAPKRPRRNVPLRRLDGPARPLERLYPDQILSPAQLAQLIPYSQKALEAMRHRDQGPKFKKVNTRVLYNWSDVLDWINAGSDR